MTKKIGILFICTGKYKIFWEGFYSTSQMFFFPGEEFQKSYFVFTNAKHISNENNINVHKIYQEHLPWPDITLKRFEIFQKALPQLEEMDYLFFFNANMLFLHEVGKDILPTEEKPFVFSLHPGFITKSRVEFSYERNPNSLAYIPENIGINYYMGGLNGGLTKNYLSMVKELSRRIDNDLQHGVVAIWHDESHLNKYAIENPHLIKGLWPKKYGWPQGWETQEIPNIIILDKKNFGGHNYLRNNTPNKSSLVRRLGNKIANFYHGKIKPKR